MKKLARKVREYFRDKNEVSTVDNLETMAFILSRKIPIILSLVYALLLAMYCYFILGILKLVIIATVTAVIILITYIIFVKRFIHNFVYEYDDMQDLKFLWDCSDHMKMGVVRSRLRMDIAGRQIQLNRLQQAKNKTKNDISLDKTLKKRKSQFDSAKNLLNSIDYVELNLPQKAYKNVLSNVDKLATILDDDENGYAFVETTFNVYADEFVTILKTMTITGSLSEENKIKSKELIKAFNSYIVRTIDKIQEQNQSSINISCDVIIKNLNNTNI